MQQSLCVCDDEPLRQYSIASLNHGITPCRKSSDFPSEKLPGTSSNSTSTPAVSWEHSRHSGWVRHVRGGHACLTTLLRC